MLFTFRITKTSAHPNAMRFICIAFIFIFISMLLFFFLVGMDRRRSIISLVVVVIALVCVDIQLGIMRNVMYLLSSVEYSLCPCLCPCTLYNEFCIIMKRQIAYCFFFSAIFFYYGCCAVFVLFFLPDSCPFLIMYFAMIKSI